MRTCTHCSAHIEYGIIVRGNSVTTFIFCNIECLSKRLLLSDLIKIYKLI